MSLVSTRWRGTAATGTSDVRSSSNPLLRVDCGDGDDHGGVVGTVDDLVVLAECDPVLDAHDDTDARIPRNKSVSNSPSAGVPTNERARIQSSHG